MTNEEESAAVKQEDSPSGKTSTPWLMHVLAVAAVVWTLCLSLNFIYLNLGLRFTFFSLLRPFSPQWANVPFAEIGFACAMIVIYMAVGHLLVACFEIHVPRLMRLVLDYVFGLGAMTILIELLTMAHQLYRLQLIALFAVTIVALWRMAYLRASRRGEADPPHADMRFVRGSRASLARQAFRESLLPLSGFWARLTFGLLFGLTAVITLLTFYYGVFFAETYWDSLILYLGYARMTYLQHAFPFKAVAQVGYGLGANYPHLYPLMTATSAQLWGSWHDVFGQVAPPWCGLLTTLVVYYTVLEMSRNRLISAATALLFRLTWYSIAYTTWASDYAFAMLFAALFLYLAYKYIESGRRDYFVLATLMPPLAMHVNYLGGVLWAPWALMIVAVHLKPRYHEAHVILEDRLAETNVTPAPDYDFLVNARTPKLPGFLRSRFFWTTLIVAVLVGSTWHIRNWALTGNPVYAFFHGVFGGVNYNEEVMASADQEWLMNGDGIGRASWELYRSRSLEAKIKASWRFWATERNWAFKLAPVFLGFAVPGLLLWLLRFLAALRSKPPPYGLYDAEAARTDATLKFGAVVCALVGCLLAFHYLLGDYYLYQILPMMPAYCLAVWFFYDFCRPRYLRAILLALVIVLGILPGTGFALLGFKQVGVSKLRGERIGPGELFLLRHLGLTADEVRRLRYDHDVDMWNYINDNCTSSTILTHENRHLVFDASITLFHLDEPEIQQLWGKTREEKLAALKMMQVKESDGSTKSGIQYYLYVPNAQKHVINLRLGVEQWLDDPSVMTEVFRSAPFDLEQKIQEEGLTPEEQLALCNRLFRFNW